MLTIIAITLIMLAIAGWQVPRIVKKKQYKDLLVFFLMWFTATVYSILIAAEVSFIDPMEMIHHGVELIYTLF